MSARRFAARAGAGGARDDAGADAVASVPPQGGWSETVAYYTALAAQAPVFIYYIPGLTHVSADYDQLRQLLDLPAWPGSRSATGTSS